MTISYLFNIFKQYMIYSSIGCGGLLTTSYIANKLQYNPYGIRTSNSSDFPNIIHKRSAFVAYFVIGCVIGPFITPRVLYNLYKYINNENYIYLQDNYINLEIHGDSD